MFSSESVHTGSANPTMHAHKPPTENDRFLSRMGQIIVLFRSQ